MNRPRQRPRSVWTLAVLFWVLALLPASATVPSFLTPAQTAKVQCAPSQVYLYAGEQFDPDLGMYYLRARYHNPQTGRFWTMDSFEGNTDDPHTLHKYLFAGNDPINRIDPSGHEDIFSVSIASSLGMALRFGYDTTATAAGTAIQKTISGVQEGKTVE